MEMLKVDDFITKTTWNPDFASVFCHPNYCVLEPDESKLS